jgi:LacI family transcriptional regulator
MKKTNRAPTNRDVARLAGVSVASISRYLNHTAPLTQETAERIRQAMEALNYVPHPVARSLATNRTNTIGIVLNDIGGDFFTPLLDGLIETTEAQNYNLLIFTSKRSGHYSRVLLGPIYTDGLIVFLDSLGQEDLEHLHSIGHPIVLIHQSAPSGMEIPLVTVENKAASFRIVSHLIENHGRKRVALLKGPQGNEDAYWRETGYREALNAHNIAFDEALIAPGDFDRSVSQASVQQLIQSGVPFDAIFTGDDEAAIGALRALADAGIRVPEQVAVVGFDDQQLAPFLTPPLTTIHAPTQLVGATAARQLIRLINGETVEPEILLPTELVFRSSCGCK